MPARRHRRLIAAVAVLAALTGAACSGSDEDLDRRPFDVHVPPGYSKGTAAPLLIVLHGYGFEGKVQSLYFGLDRVTDPRGMLYVAPDGTLNDEGKTFWNATAACCAPADSEVDDSAYLASVIEQVRSEYNVDDRRIFVLGHSNGGFMAYRMACDHADVIAGIASLEGATIGDADRCDPSEPVSVIEIHGTADSVIRYEGGRNDDSNPNAPAYPGAFDTVATWGRLNGCGPTAGPGTPATRDLQRSKPPANVTVYPECAKGSTVQLWTQPDGVHVPELGDTFTEQVIDELLAHPKP